METTYTHVAEQLKVIDSLKDYARDYELRHPGIFAIAQKSVRLRELRTIGLHWPRQVGKTGILLSRLTLRSKSVMIYYWAQNLKQVQERADQLSEGAGKRIFSYSQLLAGNEELMGLLTEADEVYLDGLDQNLKGLWETLASVLPMDAFLISVN